MTVNEKWGATTSAFSGLSFGLSKSVPTPLEEVRGVGSESVHDAMLHVEIGSDDAGSPFRALALLDFLQAREIAEELLDVHVEEELDFLEVEIGVVEGAFLSQGLAEAEEDVRQESVLVGILLKDGRRVL